MSCAILVTLLLCKLSILASNQLPTWRYSNVIVLLSTAKTERIQSLMRTLARTHLTSPYCILDRVASRISAAATVALKFFMATVNGLEPLAVAKKKG